MVDYYEHIRWKRLPFVSPRRTGTGFGNAPPLRPDIALHATEIKKELKDAIERTSKFRSSGGIDPARLLVLSFDFANVNDRANLEKLGLQIIQEREYKQEIDKAVYSIFFRFDGEPSLRRFAKTVTGKYPISRIRQHRDSSGDVSKVKVDLIFDDLQSAKDFLDKENPSFFNNGVIKSGKPTKQSSETFYRVLVQFPDKTTLEKFQIEFFKYDKLEQDDGVLTGIQRQHLFDALESVRTLGPGDRIGARLAHEGFPSHQKECYFDVDLWHPGPASLITQATSQFKELLNSVGGVITEAPYSVGGTLLITKVKIGKDALEALQKYDRVARIDLPPILTGLQFSEWAGTTASSPITKVAADGPLACIIDSGLIAGHPLLSGVVVDERDFQSGESSPVDRVGHGTHVSGIVTYGDLHRCIEDKRFEPKVRLLSAKVMRRIGPSIAGFADEKRVETQLRDAITTYAKSHNCRIFNLSLGNDACSYGQGSQLPWAYVLDELAKSLDVVIVVAAGNVSHPEMPSATTEPEFQSQVREQLLTERHKLIDPASAVMALTVGALSRPATPYFMQNNKGGRQMLGAPANMPAPFTRTSMVDSSGDGLRRIIKPELVWYGGNYAVASTRSGWSTNDPGLGEISLKHDFQGGRLLTASCGTSYSAPYVTHVAALVETALRKQDGSKRASANLIRALVVHSANITPELSQWLSDGHSEAHAEERLLRVVGYGSPNPTKAIFSEDNRSVLFAEDILQEDHFHLYELELPEEYILAKGERSIKITLAYDPPVSGTRKEYISRTMWFELYRGLTADEIKKARSQSPNKTAKKVNFGSKQAKVRPTYTTLQWSTIQSATFIGKTKQSFDYRIEEKEPVIWHVLVGSTKRFELQTLEEQRYALVLSVEHSDTKAKIHLPVRAKNVARIRQNWKSQN